MYKKNLFLVLLFTLLLTTNLFASDFGKYKVATDFGREDEFRSFIKDYFGTIRLKPDNYFLGDYIIESLRGVPGDIIYVEKNVLFADACMAHHCTTKGALVLDLNTNEALFGIVRGFESSEIIPDENIINIIQQGDNESKDDKKFTLDYREIMIAYKDDDFHNKYQHLIFNWAKKEGRSSDNIIYIKIARNTKAPILPVEPAVPVEVFEVPETFYGVWRLTGFLEFFDFMDEDRHGTKRIIEESIGREIELSKHSAILGEGFLGYSNPLCEKPSYEMKVDRFIEGVLGEKNSTFYGYKLDRESVEKVILTCDTPKDIYFSNIYFELISENEMLVVDWAGYFIFFKKVVAFNE